MISHNLHIIYHGTPLQKLPRIVKAGAILSPFDQLNHSTEGKKPPHNMTQEQWVEDIIQKAYLDLNAEEKQQRVYQVSATTIFEEAVDYATRFRGKDTGVVLGFGYSRAELDIIDKHWEQKEAIFVPKLPLERLQSIHYRQVDNKP